MNVSINLSPLVSIIVPVYNTEMYLPSCLHSIVSQTFNNWECLLIDDGSTDNSSEICDKFAKKDARIRVFHKNNGGVSAARNFGINNATGKYIIFIDSDDHWTNGTCLQSLLYQINEADLIRGEYQTRYEDGHIAVPKQNKSYLESQPLSSYDMLKHGINGEYFSVLFLFKKTAINDIRFDEKLTFREDLDFLLQVLSHPLKCVYTSECIYTYVNRSSSASNQHNIKNIQCSLHLSIKYLSKPSFSKKMTDFYEELGIKLYLWSVSSFSTIKKENKEDWDSTLALIKNTHSIITKNLSWSKEKKLFSTILLCSPRLMLLIYKSKHYFIHYYKKIKKSIHK